MTSATDGFMKNVRMEGRTLTIDGAEFADTREKLLEDLRKLTIEWHDYDGNYMRIYNSVAYAQVKELLDRQAAITERGMCAECEWPSLAAQPDQEAYDRIADLEAQLDEVTRAYKERGRIIEELSAKVDELNEHWRKANDGWAKANAEVERWQLLSEHELMARERVEKAVGNADDLTLFDMDYVPAFKLEGLPKTAEECEACQDAHDRLMCSSGERIKELEAERDHMQRVIQAQAESFRKLEAASAMPADCTECRHLDELRALRRRIRKLARFAGLLD